MRSTAKFSVTRKNGRRLERVSTNTAQWIDFLFDSDRDLDGDITIEIHIKAFSDSNNVVSIKSQILERLLAFWFLAFQHKYIYLNLYAINRWNQNKTNQNQ